MPKLTFRPSGIRVDCRADESIAEACSKESVLLPLSCKNGVCHICKGTLLKGTVKLGDGTQMEVEPDHAPEILLCKARLLTDCEIEMKNVFAKGELPLKELKCQIQAVELIDAHVYRVELLLPAGRLPEFYAGQYLSLSIPGRDGPSYFSIASAPGKRTLELHIQADPHLEKAFELIQYLNSVQSVEVALPFGKACILEAPDTELILMAAGTGFAQMKSIIEHVLLRYPEVEICLYWGVRKAEDMYLRSLAEDWDREHSRFHFYPLVADIDGNDDSSHYDQLAHAVLAQPHALDKASVFISGSPRLVYGSMDLLEEAGVQTSQFFSDVFEYAQRESFRS